MRRARLAIWLIVFAACVPAMSAHAQTQEAHGLSLFGELQHRKGFQHFPYVNPNAPKGGEIRVSALGSFDSLNPFLIKGSPADGLVLIYDTLLANSLDEPASAYALVARTASHTADYSAATFTLRAEARFHDGAPITAEDVAFSLQALREHHPSYEAFYKDVERVEILGKRRLRFHFAQKFNRELPFIVGQIPILPKHYWQDKEFGATSLKPPLGSGPYKIAALVAGRSITYERVKDYWARDLNVRRGQHNFDKIRYIYFSDRQVAFEAFKGGELDFRQENHSRNWATGYDIDAVQSGEIIRERVEHRQGSGMQAFVFNLRRAKFQDRRVRRAFNLAFDFEWSNRALFHGLYRRTDSYFSNSELAATGTPSRAERRLLRPFRDQLPPELFTEAWRNPTTEKPSSLRQNLRAADALLTEAGWEVVDGKRVRTGSPDGEPLKVEFLLFGAGFERIVTPYQRNLERLGIASTIREVDASQYQNRLRDYDFDIVVGGFGQSLSPGNEQRDFWSSRSADQRGGRNLLGLKNPVVDALVEKLIVAQDRAALLTATHALDRVLLWGDYVVPHWFNDAAWLAYRRELQYRKPAPPYAHGFPAIWWRAN